MHTFHVLPRLLLAACACASLETHAALISSNEIARPEGQRHYLLATPAQAAAGKRPLVIVLHGHAASAGQVFGKSHLNAPMQVWLDIAEREQLLVIAPNGAKGSDDKRGWNDCRADAPTNPVTDDVGFIGAVIDRAVAEYNADPARVYVMGTSNGGGMAYRLAAQMAPRLAGIAAIAALWPAKSLCPPPRQALSLLIVHGTADKIAPYAGGEVGHFLLHGRGSAIGVDETVELWRKLANFPDAPAASTFPHRDPSDSTSAQRSLWGADPRRLQIELIKIDQGGHTEPSIQRRMQWMYTALVGPQNGDVEMAEEAWRFFKDKRAPIAP